MNYTNFTPAETGSDIARRYTISSDPDKVRQEFYWDGKHDVDLIFEDDAKVKVQLIKLDDSDKPIESAVFNVVKDGQIIATEATDADGSIIG